MTIELHVPEVGESITEVIIGDWLKQVGDIVEQDEPVVVIETDKVTVDLLAPARGKLSKVLLFKGAPAKVRDLVGLLEEVTEGSSTVPRPSPSADESPQEPLVNHRYRDAMPTENAIPSTRAPRMAPVAEAAPLDASDAKSAGTWASPSARRARAELEAKGLESAVTTTMAASESSVSPSQQPEIPTPKPRSELPKVSVGREEEIVAMSPFRRTIAERLVRAQNTAALLTTFNEIDLSSVQELRHRYQEEFLKRYAVKLGFMSFFVKSVVEALKQVPVLNAEVRESDVVYKNYFDIGIAVGGGRGLVVPVIRSAEHLGLADIERAIADFGKRAKANQLELGELTGGTFTISNGGVYGSLLSTPIVNPPQSGVLGLHAIQERPVAREGQVVIRPMMYVALTYDHRIVDGREAVTFLRLVKEFVEQPARILLEV
jgi:2-oxoglutarate dehydrogenase E2 component (dihydrolipoamide succinyltransferase)